MQNKLAENYVPAGKDVGYQYIYTVINFLKVFRVRLLNGNFFSPSSQVGQHQFLVNRSMSHYLNLKEDPIGRPLAYYSYIMVPTEPIRK